MTKINANGQIEWTFDELDLDGAYQELKDHVIYLTQVNEMLLIEMKENDCFVGDIYSEFYANNFQVEQLVKIMRNIQKLIRWEVK